MTPPPAFYVPANDSVHAALEGRVPSPELFAHPELPANAVLRPRSWAAGMRHATFVATLGLRTLQYGARRAMQENPLTGSWRRLA